MRGEDEVCTTNRTSINNTVHLQIDITLTTHLEGVRGVLEVFQSGEGVVEVRRAGVHKVLGVVENVDLHVCGCLHWYEAIENGGGDWTRRGRKYHR